MSYKEDSKQKYQANDIEIEKITSTVLDLIQPSTKDLQNVKSIEKEIKDEIKKYKIPQIVEVKTGGSFAKGTNLKNDMDIDIFIIIDKDVNEQDFERIALDVGFKVLKKYNPITRYSEHPYVEGFAYINKKNTELIRLNIVPCYNVEKGLWKSAADRSQYHTEYMQKMLKPSQKNEIRILKAFLKGIGIYGAELSISGFSGYVTEVLVLKYGNFKNVIKKIATLKKKGEIISIEKISNANIYKKFQSPIIIIDPIDPNRNLGMAISSESLSRFIFGARTFLANPSIKFFNINMKKNMKNIENELENVVELLPNIVVLEFNYRIRSCDIIWGQLKKFTKSIARQLTDNEFTVIKNECYINNTNSAKLIFLLKFTKLSPFFEKCGPSIFMEKEVLQFVKKNKEKSPMLWIGDDMKLS
ncbi:MAG TPA: CCA tRNA nucleotidyltransferase, partial [Nitrososphaeraceae archaeon]|nr:CCA tRNA nucleotidyltransferase [Nitrososphaeraceae archaeon]